MCSHFFTSDYFGISPKNIFPVLDIKNHKYGGNLYVGPYVKGMEMEKLIPISIKIPKICFYISYLNISTQYCCYQTMGKGIGRTQKFGKTGSAQQQTGSLSRQSHALTKIMICLMKNF